MIGESSACFVAEPTASWSSRPMWPGIHRKVIEDKEEEVKDCIRMWIRWTIRSIECVSFIARREERESDSIRGLRSREKRISWERRVHIKLSSAVNMEKVSHKEECDVALHGNCIFGYGPRFGPVREAETVRGKFWGDNFVDVLFVIIGTLGFRNFGEIETNVRMKSWPRRNKWKGL